MLDFYKKKSAPVFTLDAIMTMHGEMHNVGTGSQGLFKELGKLYVKIGTATFKRWLQHVSAHCGWPIEMYVSIGTLLFIAHRRWQRKLIGIPSPCRCRVAAVLLLCCRLVVASRAVRVPCTGRCLRRMCVFPDPCRSRR